MIFSARENVLNIFRGKLLPIKHLDKISTGKTTAKLATEPPKHNKSKLNMQQKYLNEIIADQKTHR